MKTLTLDKNGGIQVNNGPGTVWSYPNAVEAAKCAGEFTAAELAAAPEVANAISSPATLAALALQRAAPTKA
jgi:hypothetical protein